MNSLARCTRAFTLPTLIRKISAISEHDFTECLHETLIAIIGYDMNFTRAHRRLLHTFLPAGLMHR